MEDDSSAGDPFSPKCMDVWCYSTQGLGELGGREDDQGLRAQSISKCFLVTYRVSGNECPIYLLKPSIIEDLIRNLI